MTLDKITEKNDSPVQKMETKELLMLLVARMNAEGVVKFEVHATGEVTASVMQTQNFKL